MELINRGYITECDTQIFYYDKLFEQLLEEGNTYKDLVQIVHYIIPRVLERKFKDEELDNLYNFDDMEDKIKHKKIVPVLADDLLLTECKKFYKIY